MAAVRTDVWWAVAPWKCLIRRTTSTMHTTNMVRRCPARISGMSRSAYHAGVSLSEQVPSTMTSPLLWSLKHQTSRQFSAAKVSRSQYRAFWNGVHQRLLSNLEATANQNPNNPTTQNMFYQALLRANMPAIVVERYQTGQFATNATCDAAFQKALTSLGDQGSTMSQTAGSALAGHMSGNRSGSNYSDAQLQAMVQAAAVQSRGGHATVANSPPITGGAGTSKEPLHVITGDSWGTLIFKWFKFVALFGLGTYFSLMIASVIIENISAVRKLGPGKADNEAKAEHQKVKFSDVHGCDEAKEELQELVQFLKSPTKFSTLGGKLPKGVLLVGPPGTGKTLLARAVAGEAGVPFFFMSGSEFDEVYVGVGAKRVRELFAAAKIKSPAIVFIDELDAIGAKRNPRDAAYAKQTLNQLLTELDGFEQNSGVIILAATNFPEMLDKALTRPGRFDRNVVVSLPDVRGRMAILKHHMRKIPFGKDVRIEDLAAGTPGFSGADLENIVNQAAVRASKTKATAITMQDLDWARDKVMMGAEKRSMIMTEKEKEMTAYHEAGHALICMYNPASDPLYKVTIMPRGQSLGLTMHLPEMDKHSMSLTELLAHIDVCMGGKVAEELRYGPDNVTSGCSSDLHSATQIAYNMVTRHGMSSELGNVDLASNYEQLSTATKQLIESEVRRIIEEGRLRAITLIQDKRKELDLLARALLKYETLDREEAFKVVRGEKLDHKLLLPADATIKLPDVKPGPVQGAGHGGIKLPEIPGTGAGEGGTPPPVGGLTA